MDLENNLDLRSYPYPSRRMPLFARRGVVATSEPLAAQAGLRILQSGGNAVDAAVATAITLTVTEPVSNGIGSDAFAMVWDGTRLHGLNGSGRAAASQTPALYSRLGLGEIPLRGWPAVIVPGAPAAWRDLHARFGRLPFRALFEPAIEYAEGGFPVSPLVAARWASAARNYGKLPSIPEDRAWFDTFTRSGSAPMPGERWSSPHTARTLRTLAESGVEALYRGALAKRIEEFADRTAGFLTQKDLAAHESSWVDPISIEYRGHEIWELPANTNGIIPLSALAILEGIPLAKHARESAEAYHTQIEAVKLAFADAHAYVADPEHARASPRDLLAPEYIARRRAMISERAGTPERSVGEQGGTVYVSTADADGMMVSFIQSNYTGPLLGFGSGVVIPETGIALHSRAAAFSLDPHSPNVVAPGKRPAHTLIPAFVTHEGKPVSAFGVMGGPMQPQGHVQLMVNLLEYGMNPQTSIDAPRWQWLQDLYVDLEAAVPEQIASALQARGHSLTRSGPWDVATAAPRRTPAGKFAAYGDFGKAQLVCRRQDGTYVVGSESRSDGGAVGY